MLKKAVLIVVTLLLTLGAAALGAWAIAVLREG